MVMEGREGLERVGEGKSGKIRETREREGNSTG